MYANEKFSATKNHMYSVVLQYKHYVQFIAINLYNYHIYIYIYIYINNLKIMILERGVGINHCYKK